MPKTDDVEANSLKINGVVVSFSNPLDGQTIIYNEFTDRWEPQNPPEYIADLKDVDLRGLIPDDILSWDGQRWVPNGHTTNESIHYPVESIDHNLIQNTGFYNHISIDAHINNREIHYEKNKIKHGEIQDHGKFTHDDIDQHIQNDVIHFSQQEIDHVNLINVGNHTHAQIDNHILGDGSDHGFIDQDVTRQSRPTFRGVILSEEPQLAEAVTSKAYVDTIAQGIIWQDAVHDFWDPTNHVPTDNTKNYISLASANGWRKHYVHTWTGETWQSVKPEEKWAVWAEIPDALYVFNGNKWVKIGSTSDHKNLRGIGVYNHANIDEHIDNPHIHYKVQTIDHNLIRNIGRYTHRHIDSHMDDSSVHFSMDSIDHGVLQNIGKYSHVLIDQHIDNRLNPHKVTLRQLSPTAQKGDLIIDTGNDFKPLHAGQEGQVLSVNEKRDLCWANLPVEEGSLTEIVRLASTEELKDLKRLANGDLKNGKPGMLVMDGKFVSEGDLLLLNHQTDRCENGLFRVVDRGASNLPFVITKESKDLSLGDNVFVKEGLIHRESMFILVWLDRLQGYTFSKASGDANYPSASLKKMKATYIDPSSTIVLPFDGRPGHTFDSFDPEHIYNRNNSAYVVSSHGTYLVSANLYIRSGLAQGIHKLRLLVRHGRSQKEVTRAAVRNQNDVNLTFGSVILQLQKGDMIQCVYENRTKGKVIIGNTGFDYFNVLKLR